MNKYVLPSFLVNIISDKEYKKWLQRKSQAHFRRDKKKRYNDISISLYKTLIHKAVELSRGYDDYTGEKLDWHLISKYNNKDSQNSGVEYKRAFSNLPTVDHELKNKRNKFKICSWKINDIKSDLTLNELLIECKKLIEFNREV